MGLLKDVLARVQRFMSRDDAALMLLGQQQAERVAAMPSFSRLSDVEFRVYSQWGEDGIIQHLIHRIPIENPVFVEFGVEDYRESNTRFLLRRNNWRGLVMDGDPANIQTLKKDPIYWKHDLRAVASFITKDNINALIQGAGISGDIGLLSVDIDGNDYWVWQAISGIQPRIVICEYNSVFGGKHPVTIPYQADFQRTRAHSSNLYWGASLPALCELAASKGYELIGCTSAGVNAFFVRRDLAGPFRKLSAAEGYVESRYRESRDASGALTFVSGPDRLRLIADLPVVDVVRQTTLRLGDLS
jgi:hypothetical protein